MGNPPLVPQKTFSSLHLQLIHDPFKRLELVVKEFYGWGRKGSILGEDLLVIKSIDLIFIDSFGRLN